MKRSFNLTNFLYTLVVCLFISAIGVPLFGPSVYAASGAVLIYSLMPVQLHVDGVLRNEVIKKAFTSDLQEKLWPDTTFFSSAQSDSNIGLDVEEIEIPQDEDGEARTVVNPTKFPLETYTEEDKKKTYRADLIATEPQLVTDLNQALVSYDKRAAKLRKHENTLKKELAVRILNGWSPTKGDFIRQTTGSTSRAAHAPGATGNRKRITKADILYFFTMFNDLNIPLEGRRAYFPAHMFEDLLLIEEFVRADARGVNNIISNGAVGKILTFDIFLGGLAQVYTEDSTPVKKAIGAAAATTDNLSALFFYDKAVRYCKGNVKVYINPDRGEYLGGTMNAAIRGGGTISRLSEIGVGALVEDNA